MKPNKRLVLAYFEGKTAWRFAVDTWGQIILPENYQACVYVIENTINKKCYVGHTTQKPYVRWYEHLRDLILERHLSKYLQNSWKKYGIESFEFRVLEFCGIDNRLLREQFWIDVLGAHFNIAKVAGSTLGTKRTLEDRRRFSEIQKKAGNVKKYLHTEAAQKRHKEVMALKETRENISKACKGILRSDETKKRMSIARQKLIHETGWKPAPLSEETKKKISDSTKGRKKTLEHQAKINASLAAMRAKKIAKNGCIFTDEVRKKISESNRGRKATPEQKEKASIALSLVKVRKNAKGLHYHDKE